MEWNEMKWNEMEYTEYTEYTEYMEYTEYAEYTENANGRYTVVGPILIRIAPNKSGSQIPFSG